MTALPPSSDFTGSAVTEGEFKTAITSLRAFLSELLGTTGNVGDALAALGALISGVAAKTGAYTVIAADRGKAIDCTTGTFTLSLTAAATLGAGFAFAVRNSGAGTITVDPNGNETVDGAATLTLAAGQSTLLVCTGTAWLSIGRTISALPSQTGNSGKMLRTNGTDPEWAFAGWEFVSAQEPTSDVATITFTGLSIYRHVMVVSIHQRNGATGTATIDCRTSGGTWRTGVCGMTDNTGACVNRVEISNFNVSDAVPKLATCVGAYAGAPVDRSNATAYGLGEARAGYGSYTEVWDELRLVSSNTFEGSGADTRAYFAVFGIRG